MSIEVVRASLEDLDDLADLFRGYRQFYRQPPEPDGERDFIRDRLATGDSVILLGCVDAVAAGFTQLYPLFSSVRMKPIYILNDLFVSDKFRGKGVADALMQAAESHAESAGYAGLELATEKTNRAAKKLYEKRDWTLDSEFDHYSRTL